MGGEAFGARGDVSTFETPLAASPTISNRRTSHSNVQRIEASCCFVFSAQTSRLKRELCSAGILPDVIIRQPQMDDCHCVTLSYTTPSPHCWKSMCLPEWKVMVGVGMFSQSSDWHNRKLAKQDLSPQRRWSQVEAFLLWHRGSDTNTEAHLLLGKDRPTTFANLTNQRAPSSLASIIPKVFFLPAETFPPTTF